MKTKLAAVSILLLLYAIKPVYSRTGPPAVTWWEWFSSAVGNWLVLGFSAVLLLVSVLIKEEGSSSGRPRRRQWRKK